MHVGRKIEKWRTGQNLSQRDAAAMAGVSQATWCAVERGDFKRIGFDVAQRLVSVCAGVISLDDFASYRRRPAA